MYYDVGMYSGIWTTNFAYLVRWHGQLIAENTTVKRSSAISKHVSFWAGQIPAGQTSPKGTISEMAARAFYCCLYAMGIPRA